jgi:3-hydroxyacyl-[acyl-carrier-protein] dehydratase
MLLNSFYEINRQSESTAGDRTILSAQITINKTHPIFQGHFPGMPVVPGVCMIQIIKEIFESHSKLSVSMTDAGNIKFLSVINPEINNELNAEISFKENSGAYDIDARLYFNDTIFFKIKCILSAIV